MTHTTPSLALGFFDGVHAAHARVLSAAVRYAAANGTEAVALTFDRSPREAITGVKTPLLCTPDERERLIKSLGIDRVITLPFDEKLQNTPAREFLEDYILKTLGAGYIAAGYDYRFGAGGAGDAEFLRRFCAAHGVTPEILPREDMDGEKISSSRIRGLIAAGELGEAARLLGRDYAFTGEVLHGKALGRKFGFPTMNIPFPAELQAPPAGVYTCTVRVAGAEYRAVCNVSRETPPLVEVHAFGFDRDVYGETARVQFKHFIRPMRDFHSMESLAAQVECDKKSALDWFSVQ
jgi:riboflavin kinase/FMN adenylyltransferase